MVKRYKFRLVEIELGNGEFLRGTTSTRNFIYNGNTYLAKSGIIGIDDINIEVGSSPIQVKLQLSNPDGVFTSLFYGRRFIDKSIIIREITLDMETYSILQEVVVFKGSLTGNGEFTYADSDFVSLQAQSEGSWKSSLKKGLRTNDTSHRNLYPNDGIFKYSHLQSVVLWNDL